VSKGLVVVDSSVLIFLLESEPADTTRRRRWLGVQSCLEGLEREGTDLVIPAPAVAELESVSPQLDALAKRMYRFEVRAFDVQAALVAGRMLRATVSAGVRGDESKVRVKYDALIAATAVRWGAEAIVTTDTRGFAKYFDAVQSQIEIRFADGAKGQLAMMPKKQ